MKISDITKFLEQGAPVSLAESYDNVGLLVGDPNAEVKGILINLDITEEVIDEAISNKCNLIVVHHPIWFMPRKKLNGEDYVSRCIIKAVKNDVGIYAIHTNLDKVNKGVNEKICQKLGLTQLEILQTKPAMLLKLVTYVPTKNLNEVLEALWNAGAGKIGNYDEASFFQTGMGSFRPLEGSDPTIGSKGVREFVEESRIEVVLPVHLKSAVESALKKAHPYEEVAFQFIPTLNSCAEIGSGMKGVLSAPLSKMDFMKLVKETFHCGGIRYADANISSVQKVAVCGGSGSFLIPNAMRAGVDAFITGDITYHKFFDPEGKMLLLDIGHYESEQFTIDLLCDNLKGKFPGETIVVSGVNTNPVKYF